MTSLKSKLTKLAYENPDLREEILPLLRTAAVEYGQVGNVLKMSVLKAGYSSMKVDDVTKRSKEFTKDIESALRASGVFHKWRIYLVWIEATRGGLAFRVNVECELSDESTDIYGRDFMTALKKAFKAVGITF